MRFTTVYLSERKNVKSTSWVLRWRDPATRRAQHVSVGSDKRYAEAQRSRVEADINAGEFRQIKRVSWSKFVDDHVSKIAGPVNAYHSRSSLDLFGEFCRPAGPDAVTFGMVEQFVVKLKERGSRRGTSRHSKPEGEVSAKRRPLSPATVNKRLRTLRFAFNMAVKRGLAKSNPMAGWEWARENVPVPRALTGDEKKKLLKKCPTDQWRALVFLALTTGCRRNELLGLTWGRVDLGQERIVVTGTKAGRDRVQPLAPEAVAMLRGLQAVTLKDGGPFCSIRPHHVTRRFPEIVAAAKIAACTFHDLRRTFCSDLARLGVNQVVAQRLAGHASSLTTAKYYQFIDDGTKRDAVRRVAGDGA